MSEPAPQPAVLCYGRLHVLNGVRLPAPPSPGRSLHVTADYYRVGGEAAMVALALARWGVVPAVMGNALGEDAYTEMIWQELHRRRYGRIHTDWLTTDPHVRTPFTRLLTTPQEQSIALYYWHEQARWPLPTDEHMQQVRLFTTDSHAGEAGIAAARLAHAHGVPVITADVMPTHPLAALSTITITSQTTLRRHTQDDLETVAHRLREQGVLTVVFTHGSEPIRVLDADGEWHTFPSFPLPPVDTSGAGDIFRAGFLYGVLNAWPLEQTVRFAAAAAALWVNLPTPLKHAPTLEEIDAFLEERPSRPLVLDMAPDEVVCPLCQRTVPNTLFEKHWHMEKRVVRAIQRAFPAWRRADGACPACVQKYLRRAIAETPHDLPILQEGHPIYGHPDLFVLPIAVRLRANPHYTGRGLTIAFLDSGFYPHPDLTQPTNRITATADVGGRHPIAPADFSEPRPEAWHGMMTSVVAAGNGYLSNGVYAGIARDANVVLIKVSDSRGRVKEPGIVRGMRWLLEHADEYAVRIVNLSVGGDTLNAGPENELNQLVERAVSRGMVVIAASGNAGRAELVPPASAESAITVGGLDDRNVLDTGEHRLYNSNWGRSTAGSPKPELIAPSIWIAAPVLPGTRIAEQNILLDRLRRAHDDELPTLLASALDVLDLPADILHAPVEAQRAAIYEHIIKNKFITPFYQHVDGTSFAAPIVASTVAQMLEANPSLTPEQVKDLLMRTARPLPGLPEERQGYGVVQPGPAVTAALRLRYGTLGETPLSPYVRHGFVHFVYYDPRAERVSVIGDFNAWQPDATPMETIAPGMWHAAIPLPPPGRYGYKFLVDNDRWLDDPENSEKEADGYGGFNAVLVVEETDPPTHQ